LGTLTKNTKPVNDYQQWTGYTVTDGDILDFYTSLGNRYPNSVTLESIGGGSIIRLNVAHSIFRNPGPQYEDWIGLGQGANRPLPLLINEIELPKPDITIDAGTTMSWSISDMAIKDMKIVAAASGIRITIT
jgi:hypothetical protein